MPVLANLFGTKERIALGMNSEVKDLRKIGEMLAFLRQPEPPGGFKDAVKFMPLVKKLLTMNPKTVKKHLPRSCVTR